MSKDIVKLDWQVTQKLFSICCNFARKYKQGEEIEIHDAVSKIGQAIGINDVDEEAKKQFDTLLKEGFGQAFGEKQAKEISRIFTKNCKPVMGLVYDCAKGDVTPSDFFNRLDAICLSSRGEMQKALQQSLGIPDDVAKLIPEKLAPYIVTVYAFAGAFKIYQKAAQDAELAREHRIEAERLANKAIAQLKVQRLEMETMVNVYMLDRLLPFDDGIRAMDQAILDDDDDGFIRANVELWELFGRSSQFKTADEFDNLMLSDEAFKL